MKTKDRTRSSRQRQIILEELKNVKSHPSAQEIYDLVRRRLPRVSLGTVYRNLELLVEAGSIKKLESSSSQRRFDGELENHYHARCLVCGRIVDLPFLELNALEKEFAPLTDYRITGHHLELVGLCPQCQAAEKQNKIKETS